MITNFQIGHKLITNLKYRFTTLHNYYKYFRLNLKCLQTKIKYRRKKHYMLTINITYWLLT